MEPRVGPVGLVEYFQYFTPLILSCCYPFTYTPGLRLVHTHPPIFHPRHTHRWTAGSFGSGHRTLAGAPHDPQPGRCSRTSGFFYLIRHDHMRAIRRIYVTYSCATCSPFSNPLLPPPPMPHPGPRPQVDCGVIWLCTRDAGRRRGAPHDPQPGPGGLRGAGGRGRAVQGGAARWGEHCDYLHYDLNYYFGLSYRMALNKWRWGTQWSRAVRCGKVGDLSPIRALALALALALTPRRGVKPSTALRAGEAHDEVAARVAGARGRALGCLRAKHATREAILDA